MVLQKIAFIYALVIFSLNAYSGTADTVAIYNSAMQKSFRAVVIKPDSYSGSQKEFETIYLLHGHGGNFSNWITKVPELIRLADRYQLLIVCPEGSTAGWYINSPIADSMQFETYIALEVPKFIDANYRSIKNRNARAITGLSMGGHGGLFLGFRHAKSFGACGSMSGAFLIEEIKDPRYGISKLLGEPSNTVLYRKHSIFAEMEHYPNDSLAIIIDCGTEDFIISMSRLVHERFLNLKIPHTYTERTGKHDWKYWGEAIEYQLLFFRNYFDHVKR